MKNKILASFALIAIVMATLAFVYPSGIKSNEIFDSPQEQLEPGFPEDVAKILETSCYDCHSDASSNAKAKLKLNFSKWNELSDAKKVGKMSDICEEVKKGSMPTARYVSNYPDRALTQEQKDMICKWADEETTKLIGE